MQVFSGLRAAILLSLLSVLAFLFILNRLALVQQNHAENRMKQQLFEKTADFAAAIDRQTMVQWGMSGFDTMTNVYQRISRQLSAYQQMDEAYGYLGLGRQDDGFVVQIAAGPYHALHNGEAFTIFQDELRLLYDSRQFAVLGPYRHNGFDLLAAVYPYKTAHDGDVALLIIIEKDATEYLQERAGIPFRAAYMLLPALLLLLIYFWLSYWRSTLKLHSLKDKLSQLETAGVFLLGTYIVALGLVAIASANRQQEQKRYERDAYVQSSGIREVFEGFRKGASKLTGFFAYSDFVDPFEWESFSGLLKGVDDNLVYGFAPLQLEDDLADNIYLSAIPAYTHKTEAFNFNGLKCRLPVLYISAGKPLHGFDLLGLEPVREAAKLALQNQLLTGTRAFYLNLDGNDNATVLALSPVYHSYPVTDPHNLRKVQGFVFALMDIQDVFVSAIASTRPMEYGIAMSLLDIVEDEQPGQIATYPLHHRHEGDCFTAAKDARYSGFRPLFLWGRTYAIHWHDLSDAAPYHTFLNQWLIGLGGMVIVVLLSLLSWFARNRWTKLSKLVGLKTATLNKKLKELQCLNLMNDEMQKDNSTESLLGATASLLSNAVGDEYLAGIEWEGQWFPAEILQNKEATSQAMIMLLGNSHGKVCLFPKSSEAQSLEYDGLVRQIASNLGRWAERNKIKQALHTSEEQFRSLVENAFDAIYLMEDRHYSYVNQRFVELTGYSPEELTNKDFRFDALLTPQSRFVAEQRYQARQRGESLPPQYETQVLSKTGEVRDVEVSTVSVGTEDKVLVMGIIRDITERKYAQKALKLSEQELQTKNTELETLNTELTQTNERIRLMNEQLKQAKEMAEAGDKLKTAFLNNISHEVRTPLNGILGASTLITDPKASNEDREEMMDIINMSTQRLLRTITQYMDISLLSSNNMAVYPSKLKLQPFLQPIVHEYESACSLKGIDFETDFPDEAASIEIVTDKGIIEKAVNHLLDNAVKFTKTGKVRFSYTLQDDQITFCISDTGIGIDSAVQKDIFSVFMQEDSSNLRRYEGSGLGLAICKRSLELLNGKIWFESVKGEGTSFYFNVPVAFRLEGKPEVKETKPEATGVPKLVLFAEDEDSNFQVLNLLLRKKTNTQVIRAEDGQQAVELCQSHPDIDLVLMDIKMPIMDGYEATRLIKQMRPDLPVVAITAYGLSGDEKRALDAGCDNYIAKPVSKDDFLKMVQRYGVELK